MISKNPNDNELSEVTKLCAAYQAYAKARSKLLSVLPRVDSCRDPLAEFSEMLVAKLPLCGPGRVTRTKGIRLGSYKQSNRSSKVPHESRRHLEEFPYNSF
jgi:hypothetical protein